MLVAFSGATAQAGSLEEVRQEVELELAPTMAMPDATREAELELRTDEEGEIDFRARAGAEDLAEGPNFSFWVGDVFVDDDEADSGKVDLEEDPEVTFTSLSGLLLTITNDSGTVLLHAMMP